jgi:[citrate (pro-3S)-lyase] ligase
LVRGGCALFDFDTRIVSSISDVDRANLISLLDSCGLRYEDGADAVAFVEDADGALSATASLFGDVIRMVAVEENCRESNLAAVSISALLETARVRGMTRLFLYTKPEMAARFASLGFRNIAETDEAALLETGAPGIGEFRKFLASQRFEGEFGRTGAIVANCNPFTVGHRYLIESALRRCDRLYVLLVEEEGACFSFDERLAMTEAGTADLESVRVLRSGRYAVSGVTFPTYFLKERGEASVAAIQAALDLNLFIKLYVPALGVNVRFVGTEPDSAVTKIYNDAMKEMLPPAGVEVVETPRVHLPSGEVVSASRVRLLLGSRDAARVSEMVPATTLEALTRTGRI